MTDIYNKYDTAKGYDQIQYRADRTLQSRELNELQSGLIGRIKSVADGIYKDGDLVRDARING